MEHSRLGWYNIVLHGALIAFCGLALLLTTENRRLKSSLPSYRSGGQLVAGTYLPPIRVNELDGRETELRLDHQIRETIAMVFSTKCGICSDNLSNWSDLYEKLGDSHAFVGIGIDSDPDAVRSYATARSMPYRVVTPVDRLDFMNQFAITGVPQTILVGADGRVKKAHAGRLEEW